MVEAASEAQARALERTRLAHFVHEVGSAPGFRVLSRARETSADRAGMRVTIELVYVIESRPTTGYVPARSQRTCEELLLMFDDQFD